MTIENEDRGFRLRWKKISQEPPLFTAYDGDLSIGTIRSGSAPEHKELWWWSIFRLYLGPLNGYASGKTIGTIRQAAHDLEDAYARLLPQSTGVVAPLEEAIALYERNGVPLPESPARAKRIYLDGHPFPEPEGDAYTIAEWIEREHWWHWQRLVTKEGLTIRQAGQVWKRRWAERMAAQGVEGLEAPPFGRPLGR